MERSGFWIQTFTGVRFDLGNPRPEDVQIEDVAHALSLLPRFTGHTTYPYSVAQHSVLVAKNVPRPDAKWGLLHDAAEAYLNDLGRPVKLLMRDLDGGNVLSAYDQLEQWVMEAVCQRFDLPVKAPPSVKQADNILLATERRDLMGDPQDWHHVPANGYRCLEERIVPWPHGKAEEVFLKIFAEV